MKVVLATKNAGKLKELSELAGDLAWLELALAPPEYEAEETGTTYEQNAGIKALAAGRLTGAFAVADDSGLAVDALDGRPGVLSARYGEGSDALGRKRLLEELEEVADGRRGAAFHCVMALYSPAEDRVVHTAEGLWRGRIARQEKGSGGFGFDPVFLFSDDDVTAAEISSDQKNRLSHRGQAWRKMLDFLKKNFMPA